MSASASPAGRAATPDQQAFENATYRKVALRFIPFLMLCYVVAYLDRINIGIAKLNMLADLQFSEAAYGLGAGLFFIGYMVFEVPSNLIMHRVGARLWIARIMIPGASCRASWPSSPRPGSSTPCASCSAWPRPASIRA